MRYNLLFATIIILAVIAAVFVLNFKTGKVVVEYQEVYSLNNNLTGQLALAIQQGDSLDKNTPLMISLIQGQNVIDVKILTLEDFVSLSDNPVPAVQKENGYFFEQPQTYNVEISKIISYQFTRPGQYELLFNIPQIDLRVRKTNEVN